MAVVKLNKKKTIVMFIDDGGKVYSTSINFLMGLMMGKSKHEFILLSRLPMSVAPDRFAKSPLYDPDGNFKGDAEKTLDGDFLTTTNDVFSEKANKEKEMEIKDYDI